MKFERKENRCVFQWKKLIFMNIFFEKKCKHSYLTGYSLVSIDSSNHGIFFFIYTWISTRHNFCELYSFDTRRSYAFGSCISESSKSCRLVMGRWYALNCIESHLHGHLDKTVRTLFSLFYAWCSKFIKHKTFHVNIHRNPVKTMFLFWRKKKKKTRNVTPNFIN